MKDLYLKLIEIFIETPENRERFTDLGLDPVKHIDLYSGQDVNPEYFELAVYPALFIHFHIDHVVNEATITVRVCYEQLRDTSSVSAMQTEALKFFDFIDLVDELITGTESESFGKLQPATTDQQTEETVTDEFILTYTASYQKNTAAGESYGTYEDVDIQGKLYKNLL